MCQLMQPHPQLMRHAHQTPVIVQIYSSRYLVSNGLCEAHEDSRPNNRAELHGRLELGNPFD
jgi:hypothetical protein